MDDKQLKRELPFDLYGRYAITRDIINSNRQGREKLKILDVGGRGNYLRMFLPDDDVFYLDPHLDPEEKDENYLEGDGCDIASPDASFDFVVSADVYEHVESAKRDDFLRENVRVARLGVILTAPFYSKETELADRYANENFRIISRGEDHAWLKEHIEHGLPRSNEVEDYLEANGYAFQRIPNNSLWLWESLIFSNFIAGEQIDKFEELNYFYNENLFPYDHGEDSYRKIYFIKKEKGLRDLELREGPIDLGMHLEAIKNSQALLSGVFARDRERIESLARENQEKQEELAKKNRELAEKTKEIYEKEQEIEDIHATVSWRVTMPLRAVRKAQRLAFVFVRKSWYTIQSSGPYQFLLRVAGYFIRRLAPGHASKFGLITPQKCLENRRWYEENKKPVTIVIPSYNDYKLLSKCLSSIDKTVDASMVDIVIVDDGSPDEKHLDFLKSINRDNVRVIFNEENRGFAGAVNTGLESVVEGDVIILNSDVKARKYWLESLQFAAYSHEKIGIVGGKLLYRDGRIQYGGSHRKNQSPEWFDHYYRFRSASYGPANIPNYVIGITGACMYVKRGVIEKIGYMDENFPMAFEDMDYCLRAWNEGFRSCYYPMATLVHYESASRGTRQGAREKESLRYFWEKWGEWCDRRNVFTEDGRLRVIYVLQATGVGGGHRLVFEHINRLKKAGIAVELYALEGQPEWFPLDVQVKTFADYEELISALEGEEAIKVATWWETAEPVWLASVNRGIPVYYVQDIETSYYKGDHYMQQVVLSRYRQEFNYVTESNWNAEQLEDITGLEPFMLGCGIDAEVFHLSGEKREKNVLLALGRGNYLKNLEMTLKAWQEINNGQPQLWMFGIEPELAEGLENAKYFLRPTDDEVNSLYNRATIFVQSSRHEGFCLPVLEAMAAGAPVICTKAHGNDDFCIDEVNCLIVEQEDVKGLRAAIVRLLSDTALQEKLRTEGYRTAAKYSWPAVTEQLLGFYQDIAAGSARIAPGDVLEKTQA